MSATFRNAAIWGLVVLGALTVFQIRERGGLSSVATMISGPVPDTLSASFSICGGDARVNCVVDGDTFWFRSEKIRVADIDTPELSPPRCAEEARRGEVAKRRLHALLNAGAFSMSSGWRDEDQYGRKLRTIYRNGTSIGAILVAEGLARSWGGRRSWCD